MTERKCSVYYASSQGIKGSSRNIKRMDGCQQLHFSPQRSLRWGGWVGESCFTQLHPAPAGGLRSAADYSSQLGFYCVSLPEDAFKTLQTFDLSTGRHTCAHNRTFSVEFFGSTLNLLT